MRTILIFMLVVLGGGNVMGASSRQNAALMEGTITNIAECLNHVRKHPFHAVSVRLHAAITLVNRERNLFVLQDASAAMAVYASLDKTTLKPGERVSVSGRGVFPVTQGFPAYPNHPSERGFLKYFQEPSGLGQFYLSRIRGYLHPPVTGKYTFWIAADDAGKLYLSSNASPGQKRKIAENRIGNSARPHEWDHYPSQRSGPILLKAGQAYYIEALHEQNYGTECLAVAWKGPGIKRSVIGGGFLTPWVGGAGETGSTLYNMPVPTNGLFWERWTNFLGGNLQMLRSQNLNGSFVRIPSLKLNTLAGAEMPVPLKITPQKNLDTVPNLRWVELEGKVDFAAGGRHSSFLELKLRKRTLDVKILHWSGWPIERFIHLRVRVRGVLEHDFDAKGQVTNTVLWVPDRQQVRVAVSVDNSAPDLNRVPICDINPSNPRMNWGRRVTVRGRIVKRTTNGLVVLEGDNNYQGYYSKDGTNWISLGRPVEIGLSNSVFAGLAVASRSATNWATANFRYLNGWGKSWSGADIGSPAIHGQFNFHHGVLTVQGSGAQIWSKRDQQYFVYQPLGHGNMELSAKLVGLQSNRKDGYSSHVQAGIMVRESLNRQAPYAAVLFSPIDGPVFQYRRSFDQYSARFPTERVYRRVCWMKLVKRKSFILVQCRADQPIPTNQVVSISGNITWHDDTPVLTRASFWGVQQNSVLSQSVIKITQQNISIGKFSLMAVHPPRTYRSHYLKGLDLRGIVTFCGDVMGKNAVFILGSDGSGIRVSWPGANVKPQLKAGQLVEMSGSARVRRFPVMFESSGIKVEGWGTLPEPTPYSEALLKRERSQGAWVQVTGVIRSQQTNGLLNLMTSSGVLPVWVGHCQRTNETQYVDSLVRMRGVLSFNSKRSVRLLVPNRDFLEILEPSPTNPFSVPCFPIVELTRLRVKPDRLRKMKLKGVITCTLPDEVCVQDQSGGALVQTRKARLLRQGDLIEAVGFPETDSTSLILKEADVRQVGQTDLPKPIHFSADSAKKGRHTGVLVSLKAKLIDQHKIWGRQTLVLQAGKKMVEATLVSQHHEPLPKYSLGSLLSITGVWQIGRPATPPGTGMLPSEIKIWLPTAASVIVLARPPWWTLKRVAWLGCLFACAFLGALIWVRILRRRVAQRTRLLQTTMSQLEKESRAAAVLAERDRLAGEIHDSLEQGLTAIMLQLDMAKHHVKDLPQTHAILCMARNMAEFSRAEVQHAVWDIQSPLLDNANLGTALKHLVAQISFGSPKVSVEIVGSPLSLPSSQEHHLLRIAQEAITNAVKHSQARNVDVILEFTRTHLKLTIEDDGAGFDLAAVKQGDAGGRFGLQGMRARANKIEARLQILSQSGKGTIITIEMEFKPEPQSNVSGEYDFL